MAVLLIESTSAPACRAQLNISEPEEAAFFQGVYMRFKGVLATAWAVLSMLVAVPVIAGVNSWSAIVPGRRIPNRARGGSGAPADSACVAGEHHALDR
jgi:hypothetical protein